VRCALRGAPASETGLDLPCGGYLGSSAGIGYLIPQAEGASDLAGIILLNVFAPVLKAVINATEDALLVWRRNSAGTPRFSCAYAGHAGQCRCERTKASWAPGGA
jgi:hypothetical protein